jgi:GT2 family glycosyltransferase
VGNYARRMETLRISVVVPTFNRRELVQRTLRTIFSQSAPADAMEVIAVVDGSTDRTAEALRSLTAPCAFRVIEQENRGLAGARNTGWRAARADLVLFLDDDMLCDRQLVSAHLQAHSKGERLVAFGALFLSDDSPYTLAAECFNREIGAMHLAHHRSQAAEWRETDCVFSNSSLSRKILEEFGAFDEHFRMREDLELGLRLFRGGVGAKYIADAKAFQYYAKSSADLLREAEAFGRADAQFAQKHPEALIEGQLKWFERESGWKHRAMRVAARTPRMWDAVLAPMCGLGALFMGDDKLREMGVRALQIRRRLRWLHAGLRDLKK